VPGIRYFVLGRIVKKHANYALTTFLCYKSHTQAGREDLKFYPKINLVGICTNEVMQTNETLNCVNINYLSSPYRSNAGM
jgi:hypothetical protein